MSAYDHVIQRLEVIMKVYAHRPEVETRRADECELLLRFVCIKLFRAVDAADGRYMV